jgi:hypothetical protein
MTVKQRFGYDPLEGVTMAAIALIGSATILILSVVPSAADHPELTLVCYALVQSAITGSFFYSGKRRL